MRNKFFTICLLLLTLFSVSPKGADAQESSLNTFSPYSFYGIGDIEPIGNAFQRAMGGVGVAYRSYYEFNPQNPASYSAIPRNSFIFNAGVENKGMAVKTEGKSTSHNTANLRDLGLVFPLYKGIGMGFSLSPLSSVGYKMDKTDASNLANLGLIKQNYWGEGGIAELKLGIGVELFKRLSLGANVIFYKGTVTNYFNSSIYDILGTTEYKATTSIHEQRISKLLYSVGAQLNVIQNANRILTLGATYQPKAVTKAAERTQITTSYDLNSNSSVKDEITFPGLVNVGAFYQTKKMGMGLDYSRQDWSGTTQNYTAADGQNITFGVRQDFKFGMSYTPNVQDIRNFMNRWTYRAGLRYSTNYMIKGGQGVDEKAISLGASVPFTYGGVSSATISVELGTRGRATATQIRENFARISLGFTLFGEDRWFVKHKIR